MLSFDQLTQIESILNSDRVSLRGHEALGYARLLAQVQQARQMADLMRKKNDSPERVKPLREEVAPAGE